MVIDKRAVSTVLDVGLALLIISASVLLIGFYLSTDEEPIERDRADRAYQTLSGSTVTITYDVSAENESGHAATDSEKFQLPDDLDPEEIGEPYRSTTYGSATGVLGEAALTNLAIDEQELFAYGHDVEKSTDDAIRSTLIGSEGSIYAIATWQPYENASIGGSATAGERPPTKGDVSGTTGTVSSSIPAVDSEDLATEFYLEQDSDVGSAIDDGADGFDAAGVVVAETIVEGLFLLEDTQYALESTLTQRAVVTYNYRKLAESVDVDVDDHVTGTNPDAAAANEALVGDVGDDEGLGAVIAEDLRSGAIHDDVVTAWRSGSDRYKTEEELAAVFDEHLSTETIEITVQVGE